MAVRGKRAQRKHSGDQENRTDRQPRGVVAIRVHDNATGHMWVTNADGDLSDQQADAHRFIIDDARVARGELKGSYGDVSLIGLGDESTVEPS